MAPEALQEFVGADKAITVTIKPVPNGVKNNVRETFNAGDGGILFAGNEAIFAGDFGKLGKSAFFNFDSKGMSSRLNFGGRKFTVTIEINGGHSLLSHFRSQVADGLPLFFVNLTVIVGVKLLKKFWKQAVSEHALIGQSRCDEGDQNDERMEFENHLERTLSRPEQKSSFRLQKIALRAG